MPSGVFVKPFATSSIVTIYISLYNGLHFRPQDGLYHIYPHNVLTSKDYENLDSFTNNQFVGIC